MPFTVPGFGNKELSLKRFSNVQIPNHNPTEYRHKGLYTPTAKQGFLDRCDGRDCKGNRDNPQKSLTKTEHWQQ